MNAKEQLREAMNEAGLPFQGEIITDGILHRFYVEGDKSQSRNGWYILFEDETFSGAGAFGCWKRGITGRWSNTQERLMSSEEKNRYRKRMVEVRRQREEEKERLQAECRILSSLLWEQAPPATDSNAYLALKGVHASGAREINGTLLIPVRDAAGDLHGLQFISPDGTKKFKTGTAKTGHYFAIGRVRDNTILICEGYATGATLHEATNHAVAVAFDAGNLKPVALTIQRKYPDYRLIICADNDTQTEGNPGLTRATEAARVVNGLLAVPQFSINAVGDDSE